MKPYHHQHGVSVYKGDALAVLRALPTASVDAVIADPPYSSGGAFRGDRAGRSAATKYVTTDAALAGPTFTGDNRDQRSWTHWCSLWLSETLRVAREGSLLVMFTDWRQLPSATDAIQSGGWVWRGIVPWTKPAHRARPTRGGFRNQTEFLVWGSAGPMRADHEVYLSGHIHAAAPGTADRIHITEKPREVFDLVVRAAPPGGTVLDPFAGGGGSLVAARRAGRSAIGIELDEQYCRVIVDHLARADRQGDQPALGAFE